MGTPISVAVDNSGNLYLTSYIDGAVRKVSNGVITTVADNDTTWWNIQCIAVDAAGNLYISDMTNNRIHKVSNGVKTTVAGVVLAGLAITGRDRGIALQSGSCSAIDGAGNLYIADTGSNRIREISNGVITTVAGDGVSGFSGDNGPATRASLYLDQTGYPLDLPGGLASDASGNVYITDIYNDSVRMVFERRNYYRSGT